MSVTSTQSELPSTGLAWLTLAVSTGALVLLCVWALFNQSTLFPDKYRTSVEPLKAPLTTNTELQDANLLATQEAEKAQLANEQRAAEQAAEKALAAEQLAAAKLAEEQVAAEQLATEQLAAELAAATLLEEERLAAEQLAAAKLPEEQVAAEQLGAELATATLLEEEKLAAEQLAAAKLAEEQLAAEQLAAELAAATLVEEERLAAEQLAAAKLAEEQLAAEQLAAELAAAKLLEEEKLAAEQLAEVKLEQERLEAAQLAAAKLEEERLAALAGPVRAIPEVETIIAEKATLSADETPFEALRREELSALPGLAARVRFLPTEIDIRESSKKPLDRLFELLFLYSETAVTIQVTSNEYENDNNNRLISRERALALANYLIERGLDEERFRIRALGKERLPFDSHRVTVIATVSDE